MSEPMTPEESFENLYNSIAGLGQALASAFVPAIGAIHTAAMQLAIEYESALNAILNTYTSLIDVELTLQNPERYEGESLVDWGNRLERAGLFDSYEYRLMYQKEVWRSMLHSPVWVARLAWEWLRGIWAN